MSCYIVTYLFMKRADEHVCNVLYGFFVFLSTGVED